MIIIYGLTPSSQHVVGVYDDISHMSTSINDTKSRSGGDLYSTVIPQMICDQWRMRRGGGQDPPRATLQKNLEPQIDGGFRRNTQGCNSKLWT